jgi:hypothetical protein
MMTVEFFLVHSCIAFTFLLAIPKFLLEDEDSKKCWYFPFIPGTFFFIAWVFAIFTLDLSIGSTQIQDGSAASITQVIVLFCTTIGILLSLIIIGAYIYKKIR